MSNTKTSLPPIFPVTPAPDHNLGPQGIFGLPAVMADEHAWEAAMEMQYHQGVLRWGQESARKVGAEAGRVHKLIGQVSGMGVRTPEEEAVLARHDRGGLERGRDYHAEQQALYEAETNELLRRARQGIKELTPKQAERFEKFMGDSASRFLVYAKNRVFEDRQAADPDDPTVKDKGGWSWQEWLSERADNTQLLNVFQWHIDTLEHQQSNPDIQAYTEEQRLAYIEAVKVAVEDGWLHGDALEGLKEVALTKVFIGDFFDTTMHEVGGYHIRYSDYVVIEQGAGPIEENREYNLKWNIWYNLRHELNHKLGRLPYRWLDEAITEHIQLALKYGEPEEMLPHERQHTRGYYEHKLHELGAYVEERELLTILMEDGEEQIPAELFTRAYTARSAEHRTEAMQHLEAALVRAWGTPDVLWTIASNLNEYEALAKAKGLTSQEAETKAVKIMIDKLLVSPHSVFENTELIPVS